LQTILYHHPNLQHSEVGPTERNSCLFFKLETPQYTGKRLAMTKLQTSRLYVTTKLIGHTSTQELKHCTGLQLFLSSKLDFANSCLLIEINSLEYIIATLPSDLSDTPLLQQHHLNDK